MTSTDLFGKTVTAKINKAPKHRADPARIAELRLEAIKLEASLGEADEKLAALQEPYNALKYNFDAAHATLAGAWVNNDHSPEARARRKPLYDARMDAGVAWNPIKQDYQNMKSWRRTIVLSLKAINEELSQ